LHFALKTAQGILEGFSLLESNFRQWTNTPKLVQPGRDSYCKVLLASQVICVAFGQIGCGRERILGSMCQSGFKPENSPGTTTVGEVAFRRWAAARQEAGK
jgi:hypothetical protein